MFIIDDLLLRPLVGLLDTLHTLAMDERREELEDALKENRLLYEIGEIDREEYERYRDILEAELELAEEAHEQLQRRSIEVQR